MDPSRSVALVGRPNVGKSRLFNRLVGRRVSIVHDQPGVTRDCVVEEVSEGQFILMDTGGIGMQPELTPAIIQDATEQQVQFALEAASLVLFVTDGREGLTPLDMEVAERLRASGKECLLLVNKLDAPELDAIADEFFKLGFGTPHACSAEHGRGMEDLLEIILGKLGPAPEPDESAGPTPLSFSLVGRPNVGKSSLANRLVGSPRLIVSDVPGTTRDAVHIDFDYKKEDGALQPIRLIDTAGLRAKKKLRSSVDFFSSVRTEDAILHSDLVFLVLDALEGVTSYEKKLAGHVLEAGRSLVMVVNKWDHARERFRTEPPAGYRDLRHFRKDFEKHLRKELFFLPDSPVLFTSALEDESVEGLLGEACRVAERLDTQLPTGPLNRTLEQLMEKREPRLVGGRRFKVFYAVQVRTRPITIRLFCNQAQRMDESYGRYLEHGLRRTFELDALPLRFEMKGKEKRYAGKK